MFNFLIANYKSANFVIFFYIYNKKAFFSCFVKLFPPYIIGKRKNIFNFAHFMVIKENQQIN